MAKRVIDQLIKFGRTRRGWLGVRIQSVTDELAEGLGLDKARGALVAGITEGSPSAKAGIEAGDVITSFDGKDIPEMRALPRIVAETEVGKEVHVQVWRKGKNIDLKVTLGELEKAEEVASLDTESMPETKERGVSSLGLKLSAITPELRERYSIKDEKGVVVTEVDEAGSAAEKGLRPGDVIVEVSQEEVESPAQVAEKVAKVQEDERKSVLLLVKRGDDLRFVAVRLAEK
jgi:serine protease Do